MTPDPIFNRHPDGITLNIPLPEGAWIVPSLLGIGILLVALRGLIRAIQSPPKWARLPPLPIPSWIVWPLILLVLVLAASAIWQFFKAVTGLDIFADNAEQHAAIRNSGLVVAALIGVPFLVWRSVVAQKQVNVAEQSHITDQINKAVENIGARYSDGTPNIEVRIGGLLALERISKHVPDEHVQIMEILCAYIRKNSSASSLEPSEPPFPINRLRIDLDITIGILCRRSEERVVLEHSKKYRLNLAESDLSGATFTGDFSAASLCRSRLEACRFNKATLRGADFTGALLNYSHYTQADLYGAKLNHCIFNEGRNFGSPFYDANVRGLSIVGADLSAARIVDTQFKQSETFGSLDTKLHRSIQKELTETSALIERVRSLEDEGPTPMLDALRAQLEQSGFQHWCPYSSDDLALGHYLKDFTKALGLDRWPYYDFD